MIHRIIPRLFIVVLPLLVIISVISAFAANISVPITRLTNQTMAITADTLKPAACSATTVTVIVYCPITGTCDGTSASELMLGSPNDDTIRGRGGSDCILGGGGDDDIIGNQSSDVCIGGPGTDTFKKCETSIQ